MRFDSQGLLLAGDGNSRVFMETLHEFLMQDEAKEKCQLLGNWFGYLVQFLLGALAFSSLLIKWWRENPRRDLFTFFRDTSKQAAGACLAHVLNLVFAELLTAKGQNPCIWYLANILVESVLGLLMAIGALKMLEWCVNKYRWAPLRSGYYGDPPRFSIWLLQLGVWCLIVCTIKVILLFGIIVPLEKEIYDIGTVLVKPFDSSPKLELVMVMVVVPVIVNTIIFWITDDFLMHDAEHDNYAQNSMRNHQQSKDKDACSLPSSGDAKALPAGSFTDDIGYVAMNDRHENEEQKSHV